MPFEEPDDIASDIRAAFDAPAAAPEPLAPAPELDGDLAAAKAPDQSSEVSNEGDSRARDESGRFAKKEGVANPVEQAQPVVATPQAVAEPPLETIRPPASWSATAKSQFAALDPVIQKEILKREGDIETGKAQWDAKGEKLNRYEALIAPYREKFAVQGLDEFAAINALLNAQTMLEKNPAEAIAYLARQYGAPLPSGPLAQQQAFQPQQQQPDPQYLQLATQVQSLQQFIAQQQQATEEREFGQVKSDVEAFRKDNLYFDNVKVEMGKLIQAGMAPDIQTAYDMACYANPEIRALLIAQNAPKPPQAPPQVPAGTPAGLSVVGSPGLSQQVSQADPNSSIEDDVRAALKAVSGRV
jgi:hypothetical protein